MEVWPRKRVFVGAECCGCRAYKPVLHTELSRLRQLSPLDHLPISESFECQVKNLAEPIDVPSIVDLHLLPWEFLLKEWDQSGGEKVKQSMTKMGFDKLKHDIKGSTSQLKILLRNLESGDMDLNATMGNLRSRSADLASL